MHHLIVETNVAGKRQERVPKGLEQCTSVVQRSLGYGVAVVAWCEDFVDLWDWRFPFYASFISSRHVCSMHGLLGFQVVEVLD